jgi:polyferredoxin
MMKFLYILSILFAGLIALSFILVGFESSLWFGLFALLVGAPVVFLLTVIFSRVFLQMILVVFRMADHTADRGMANVKEKAEPREGIQWNV